MKYLIVLLSVFLVGCSDDSGSSGNEPVLDQFDDMVFLKEGEDFYIPITGRHIDTVHTQMLPMGVFLQDGVVFGNRDNLCEDEIHDIEITAENSKGTDTLILTLYFTEETGYCIRQNTVN